MALVEGDGEVRVVDVDGEATQSARDPLRAALHARLVSAVGSMETLWTAPDGPPAAVVAVPMLGEGQPVGSMGLAFPAPRIVGPEERAFLLTLGRLGGQAVERARLYADAQAARRDAEEARRRAEQASQAKSQFLATMSHERRTPLNAIRGYADLISIGVYGPVTREQNEALARIRRSEAHLLGLINEILEFARIEAKPPEYRREAVPLEAVMADARAFVEPQLRAKALGFQTSCERGRSALADPDTGIGIPSDQVDRIFQPFVQLGRTLSAPASGTGLGLAISRDLARGMGGDLTVEREAGRGATFTLTLPKA